MTLQTLRPAGRYQPHQRASDRDEVKALLIDRIDALARHFVPDGSRSGHYWIGRCPWRADKNPGSFWINLQGSRVPGSFKDMSSGEKGDVIALAVGTVAFLAMLKLHGWLIGVSIFG